MAAYINPAELTSLPLTYRQAEVKAIARCIRVGDSCSVVGVSGMAKSNLFRHLLKRHVREYYLSDDWQKHFFLAADSNALGQITEQTIYDLLMDQLISESNQREATAEVTARLEELHLRALSSSEVLIWKRSFTQSIQTVMTSDPARHLVFLFDQFDEVYKTLPPHFFANLRFVRDEYKYRISYLLFTRDELPQLCHALECEEFYELLSPNVIALGPYDHDDALFLLARVSSRYNQSISEEVSERLIELSGGHPGILKAACIAILQGKVILPECDKKGTESFLAVEDVYAECTKIWESISDDEQRALRSIIMGGLESELEAKTIRRLKLKHLLTNRDDIPALCPIFTKYVSEIKIDSKAGTKIQAGPLRIDSAGEIWVNGRLIVPPLTKKEFLLLEYFCLEPGRLCSRDEIIAVVYPNEYKSGDTPSDEALNALVRRLRERIEQFSKGQCRIATVRGKGYRLEIT
jgi:DNA-binding winged helix-turn-helix (wHTH) protein